jgi:hypothetical protein
MKCEACERDDHENCGMQTWCECDCVGPDAIGMPEPSDIVGHKTFDTGETCPETGFPKLRHEPLTRAEADALWDAAERAKKARAEKMPDEQAAINAMFEAWLRLKEIGWREPMYCPKDGTRFRIIELGSTGFFEGAYRGKWPDGTWDSWDDRDAYASSIAPAMFRLFPEDEAKEKQRLSEARERFKASGLIPSEGR